MKKSRRPSIEHRGEQSDSITPLSLFIREVALDKSGVPFVLLTLSEWNRCPGKCLGFRGKYALSVGVEAAGEGENNNVEDFGIQSREERGEEVREGEEQEPDLSVPKEEVARAKRWQ